MIVRSQSGFQIAIGGTGDEYSSSIIQSSGGDYVIAGYTNSFGAGGNDLYIVKLSGNGSSIEWTRTIGGTVHEFPLAVIQISGGGYLVSGETNSFGAGRYDAYIMKLNSDGTILWTKTYGGAGDEYGESAKQTTDGGYVAAGYTDSFGAGDNDMYIMKLDSGGQIQWIRTIGETGYDYALSVIQTTDGGYALAGATSSSGEGFTDYYIVKLSEAGALEWARTIGGPGGDYGFSVIQTSDGGYAVSGTTYSFGAGIYDIYIVKLDSAGLLKWTRTIGGTNYEYCYAIIQTNDHGYAISASTASFGAGDYDAYIVKLDSNGSLEWNRTFGGTGYDYAMSIAQTTDGGYVTTGSYSVSEGNADIYVVKLDAGGNTCNNTSPPIPVTGTGGTIRSTSPIVSSQVFLVSSPPPVTGTGGALTNLCTVGITPVSNIIPESYNLFQNYPNPFNPNTKIKFQIPKSGLVTLVVFDDLGRIISTLVNENLNAGVYETEWNAVNQPSGIYFYRITTHDFVEVKKMVLIK